MPNPKNGNTNPLLGDAYLKDIPYPEESFPFKRIILPPQFARYK
jgi:hypothetical protein